MVENDEEWNAQLYHPANIRQTSRFWNNIISRSPAVQPLMFSCEKTLLLIRFDDFFRG